MHSNNNKRERGYQLEWPSVDGVGGRATRRGWKEGREEGIDVILSQLKHKESKSIQATPGEPISKLSFSVVSSFSASMFQP